VTPKSIAPPNLLNVAEVAYALHLTKRRVLRMIKEGKFPNSCKLSGKTGAYLITQADLEREKKRRHASAQNSNAGASRSGKPPATSGA